MLCKSEPDFESLFFSLCFELPGSQNNAGGWQMISGESSTVIGYVPTFTELSCGCSTQVPQARTESRVPLSFSFFFLYLFTIFSHHNSGGGAAAAVGG